jgi:hypothetical protein
MFVIMRIKTAMFKTIMMPIINEGFQDDNANDPKDPKLMMGDGDDA